MSEPVALELKVSIDDLPQLREALVIAWNCLYEDRKAFAFYAEQHKAKGTEDADKKAKVNDAHVARIEATQAKIDKLLGVD